MMPARPSRRISSPIVTMTAFSGGFPVTCRTTVRSSTAPRTKPATRARTNPSQ